MYNVVVSCIRSYKHTRHCTVLSCVYANSINLAEGNTHNLSQVQTEIIGRDDLDLLKEIMETNFREK